VADPSAGGGTTVTVHLSDAFYDTTAWWWGSTIVTERDRGRAALARRHERGRQGRLTVLEADFAAWEPDGLFHLVTYWSGFGVGDDDDQRALLKRTAHWLRPQGRILLDVFDPVWWRAHAGNERESNGYRQRIGFERATGRLVDEWWRSSRPEQVARETIRCYSTDELDCLLDGTSLRRERVMPPLGGEGVVGLSYLVELVPA
jgi:hypothetical protein